MISPGTSEFPDNVIALVHSRIPTYCDGSSPVDERLVAFKRQLRTSDPQQAVGVFALTKRVDVTSAEQAKYQEQTLKRYHIIFQSLVQDSDQEACISVHSILSARLWRMWFRDSVLDTGLHMLSVTADNSIERLQRRGVEHHRYLSNEVQGTFIATSWMECWVETETVET